MKTLQFMVKKTFPLQYLYKAIDDKKNHNKESFPRFFPLHVKGVSHDFRQSFPAFCKVSS